MIPLWSSIYELVPSGPEGNVFKFRPAVATAVGVLLFAVAPSAFADTIQSQGNTTGTRYHGGDSANGGISYAVGLQVAKNSAGQPVNVRAVGRISRLSKVSRVQVDSVVLGSASSALVAKNVPVNSGTAISAISFTNWKALVAGSCGLFRTRANFSVRWADGTVGMFSILSPLSQVCRSGTPGDKILTVARSYLGTPYGGQFDCSGYTQLVYRQAGVADLVHNAEAQRRQMRIIPRSQAQPGDLIFYMSGTSAYHVAIFAGGSMQYAANVPGGSVVYQGIWSNNIEFGTDWH